MFGRGSGAFFDSDEEWQRIKGVGGMGWQCRSCKKIVWQEECPTTFCSCSGDEPGHKKDPGQEHRQNLSFFGLNGDEY